MRRIPRSIGSFIRTMVSALDLLIPKSKEIWSFEVGRDNLFIGNLAAFAEYCSKNLSYKFCILALDPRKIDYSTVPKGITIYKIFSIHGIWIMMRSRVWIIQHARVDLFSWRSTSCRRVTVNLWHGIPIKGIRRLSLQEYGKGLIRQEKESRRYSGIICSSKIDRLAMAAAFLKNYDEIWLTGLPRNDVFFLDSEQMPLVVRKTLDRIENILKGRHFILYAPTFRGNSIENYTTGLYPIVDDERNTLETWLESNNFVLGVRTHNYFAPNEVKGWVNNTSIIDASSEKFPDPQGLLLRSEILVTDYSSIWIDYMLCKRPIGGFLWDKEAYEQERGMIYELEDVFPGSLFETFPQLIEWLDIHKNYKLSNPVELERLDRSLKFFMKYQDARASERIIEKIQNELAVS